MDCELLDRYLLEGAPEKQMVVADLLAKPPAVPQAAPFLEGMRTLQGRTPDLALAALRLVLAGKPASDESVVALRDASLAARKGGPGGEVARKRYRELLAP